MPNPEESPSKLLDDPDMPDLAKQQSRTSARARPIRDYHQVAQGIGEISNSMDYSNVSDNAGLNASATK